MASVEPDGVERQVRIARGPEDGPARWVVAAGGFTVDGKCTEGCRVIEPTSEAPALQHSGDKVSRLGSDADDRAVGDVDPAEVAVTGESGPEILEPLELCAGVLDGTGIGVDGDDVQFAAHGASVMFDHAFFSGFHWSSLAGLSGLSGLWRLAPAGPRVAPSARSASRRW